MNGQRKPHAGPAPQATAEQLLLAYRQLNRPHWPTTLESALAHPVYGPAVRGLAANLGCAAVCQAKAPTRPAGPPSTHVPRWARHAFDPRRAAANDKDDTE